MAQFKTTKQDSSEAKTRGEKSDGEDVRVGNFVLEMHIFNCLSRKRLFGMINELPTIYEIVSGKNKSRTASTNNSSNKSKSKSKAASEAQQQHEDEDEGYVDEEEEHGDTLCGACGGNYGENEFWICCDICENWFHGKCVKITPARAEHIKKYKCPSCSNKRQRLA